MGGGTDSNPANPANYQITYADSGNIFQEQVSEGTDGQPIDKRESFDYATGIWTNETTNMPMPVPSLGSTTTSGLSANFNFDDIRKYSVKWIGGGAPPSLCVFKVTSSASDSGTGDLNESGTITVPTYQVSDLTYGGDGIACDFATRACVVSFGTTFHKGSNGLPEIDNNEDIANQIANSCANITFSDNLQLIDSGACVDRFTCSLFGDWGLSQSWNWSSDGSGQGEYWPNQNLYLLVSNFSDDQVQSLMTSPKSYNVTCTVGSSAGSGLPSTSKCEILIHSPMENPVLGQEQVYHHDYSIVAASLYPIGMTGPQRFNLTKSETYTKGWVINASLDIFALLSADQLKGSNVGISYNKSNQVTVGLNFTGFFTPGHGVRMWCSTTSYQNNITGDQYGVAGYIGYHTVPVLGNDDVPTSQGEMYSIIP